HAGLHLGMPRQGGYGVDRQYDCHLSDLSATPDDAHIRLVARGAANDDLVDETAEQRFSVLTTQRRVRPELGKPLAEGNDLGAQTRIEAVGLGRRSGFLPRERLLGSAELQERGLPASLQLGCDEPVVGIDSVELPLGETRLVAETVDLLR